MMTQPEDRRLVTEAALDADMAARFEDPDSEIRRVGNATYGTKAEVAGKADKGELDEVATDTSAARAAITAPATLPPARPRVSWITTFQVGHGWSNPFSFGEIADDTTHKVMGDQSLLLDASASSSASAHRAASLDLSEKSLCLWVRVEDAALVESLFVYAGTGSSLSDSYIWNISPGGGSPWYRSGEWMFITLPWSPSNTLGTPPSRSGITNVRVRVNGSGSRVWLGGFGTVPAKPRRGVVSITFDDGYSSVIEAARRVMTPRGITGTAYIIPQYIDAPSGNFMTMGELRELRDIHGWDLESHGPSGYTTMTQDEMRAEWTATKRWFAHNALGRGDHIAYVGGQTSPEVLAVAREFFTTGRTISGTGETFPPGHPHRIRAISSISGHSGGYSATRTMDRVDEAAAHGHWCILTFHRIVEGAATHTNDCSWEDFETIVNHVVSADVDVLTIDEAARITG